MAPDSISAAISRSCQQRTALVAMPIQRQRLQYRISHDDHHIKNQKKAARC